MPSSSADLSDAQTIFLLLEAESQIGPDQVESGEVIFCQPNSPVLFTYSRFDLPVGGFISVDALEATALEGPASEFLSALEEQSFKRSLFICFKPEHSPGAPPFGKVMGLLFEGDDAQILSSREDFISFFETLNKEQINKLGELN